MVDTTGMTPELNGFPLPEGCHDVVFDCKRRSVLSHLVATPKEVMDASLDDLKEMVYEN
jgi:hypothetical protein